MATNADDTTILSPGNNPMKTSDSLENHLNLIENRSSKWRIKNPPHNITLFLYCIFNYYPI